MSRWKVNSSTLWILGIVGVFMLAIVILPDVDLPDTAFHRGTAPVVVHAQANASPATVVVASVFRAHNTLDKGWAWNRSQDFRAGVEPNFRPILLRSIRC